ADFHTENQFWQLVVAVEASAYRSLGGKWRRKEPPQYAALPILAVTNFQRKLTLRSSRDLAKALASIASCLATAGRRRLVRARALVTWQMTRRERGLSPFYYRNTRPTAAATIKTAAPPIARRGEKE